MSVINSGSFGGGLKINGNKKEFKVASENTVTSGSFVRVHGEAGEDIKLASNAYSGDEFNAVKLSNNRVFITYNYGSNKYLYGVVATINNTSITCGTATRLSTTTNLGTQLISTTVLDDNRILICHCNTGASYIYYFIVTISNTDISVGAENALSEYVLANYIIASYLLPNNKIAIVYQPYQTTAYSLRVATITENGIIDQDDPSETYITNGGDGYDPYFVSMVYGNVLLIIYGYSAGYLYASTHIISEDGSFETVDVGKDLSGTLLRNFHVYDGVYGTIINSESGLSAYVVFRKQDFHSTIVDIYGVKFPIFEDGSLIDNDGIPLVYAGGTNDTSNSSISISSVKNDEAYVFYGSENNMYLFSKKVSLGNGITIEPSVQLSTTAKTGTNIKNVELDDGNILILHSYGTSRILYGKIFNPNTVAQINNENSIGVASQSGDGGDVINVYISSAE